MRKILLSVLGVAVVVGAYYLISEYGGIKPARQSTNQSKEKDFSVAKKEVAANQAPSGFPSDVPIEAGATIIQNYEADVSDGRHQATRVFQSSKTVAQNYQLYLDFLTKNGWTVSNKSETETIASLYAVKAGSELTVSITKNSVTGVVTVDLSALVKK